MKLYSWSTILFLKINALQGKSRALDRCMFACANYLIYILGFGAAAMALFLWYPSRLETLEYFVLFIIISLALSLGPSWWIGWMWPHRRPIIEHPRVKQMFHPMSTWKSFPSDHTIGAFVVAEAVMLFSLPLWFGILVLCMACTIGGSRIYAGVHYPRDILGGIFFASGACLITFVMLF